MDDKLDLTEAATLLPDLTKKPFAKDNTLRIIRAGALGKFPVYWSNSDQVATRLSDFKVEVPDTDSFSRWMQLQPEDVSRLEKSTHIDVLSFALTEQDCDTLERLRDGVVDADGNVKGFRHEVSYAAVTVSRDQLFVNESDLRTFAATLTGGTDTTQPAPAVDQGRTQSKPATWFLRKPIRNDGLANPLYDKIKEHWDAGKAIPTPLQILTEWMNQKPHDILDVTKKKVTFFPTGSAEGSADITDLRKRIHIMTTPRKPKKNDL